MLYILAHESVYYFLRATLESSSATRSLHFDFAASLSDNGVVTLTKLEFKRDWVGEKLGNCWELIDKAHSLRIPKGSGGDHRKGDREKYEIYFSISRAYYQIFDRDSSADIENYALAANSS